MRILQGHHVAYSVVKQEADQIFTLVPVPDIPGKFIKPVPDGIKNHRRKHMDMGINDFRQP